MRKILLIIILFNNYIFSQKIISLRNALDNSPINFASIYSANKIISTSDSLGNFIISEKYINTYVKVSAIGFNELDSLYLNNISTIKMEPKTIEIKEILVQKNKNETFKLGKAKSGEVGIVCNEDNNNISQISKFFPNINTKNTYIEKIRFKTLCNEKNRIISILIYSVNEIGEPKELLNNENIICKLKKGHNTNEVNLNKLNIEFPENGLYISLNYLFLEQNKSYSKTNPNWYYYEPSIDASRENEFTDTWYNINGIWKKSQNYSLNLELTLTN